MYDATDAVRNENGQGKEKKNNKIKQSSTKKIFLFLFCKHKLFLSSLFPYSLEYPKEIIICDLMINEENYLDFLLNSNMANNINFLFMHKPLDEIIFHIKKKKLGAHLLIALHQRQINSMQSIL